MIESKVSRDTVQRKNLFNTTTLVDNIIIGKDKIIMSNVQNIIKVIKPHIDELSAVMATPGPEKRPSFTKVHERNFIDATGINFNDIVKAIRDCKMISKHFLTQTNEFYILISILISYHYKKKTMIGKVEFAKVLNLYLALRIYKAAFGTFFPNYLPNPEVMSATIERLNSNRFNIKKYKTIYNAVVYIADSHYENFRDILENPIDDNVKYYITNLYGRIKLMMRTICNLFYDNHEKGIKQRTDTLQSENDEGETYLNDIENISTLVVINAKKIYMSFISDSVSNPKILRSVCTKTKVSFSKMTITINKMIHSRDPLLENLIIKMLSYYYTKGGSTIKSTKFLSMMIEVYSVSNTSDQGILEIKSLLEELMIKYSKSYLETNNVGSLINLKKTLWLYLILYSCSVV